MISAAKKAVLNRFNSAVRANGLGSELDRTMKTQNITYDFSVSGGAVSSIALSTVADIQIPAGAVVTAVYTEVLTTLTSGGSATVAINNGTDTFVAAQTYSSITGIQKQTLNGSAAGIKTTVAGNLTVTIATAALTAGKVRIYVHYMESRDN